MTDAAALQIALTHYRMLYPGDWATNRATWQTEYNAVAAGAFAATLITAGSFEGGNASALKNFEQAIRLRALQVYRAETDPEFAQFDAPSAPQVMYPLFGPRCFPH